MHIQHFLHRSFTSSGFANSILRTNRIRPLARKNDAVPEGSLKFSICMSFISSPSTWMLEISPIPMPCSCARRVEGTMNGSMPIMVQATASSATGSLLARTALTCLGVPLLGPFPSMPITASITVNSGRTIPRRSTSIWENDSGSWARRCIFALLRPVTQPKLFFTPPVNNVSPWVLSFGRDISTSVCKTCFDKMKLLIIRPLAFLASMDSALRCKISTSSCSHTCWIPELRQAAKYLLRFDAPSYPLSGD